MSPTQGNKGSNTEDHPMTQEQQQRSLESPEQQSQQPSKSESANFTNISPELYQAIREQVTRDIMAQFQIILPIVQITPHETSTTLLSTTPLTKSSNLSPHDGYYARKASEWPVSNG